MGKDKNEYMKMPIALVNSEEYKELSVRAKYTYMYCLYLLEQKENRMVDADGQTYVYLPIDTLKELLNASRITAMGVFEELVNMDLIERYRQGQGKPNRIYVKALSNKSKNIRNKT